MHSVCVWASTSGEGAEAGNTETELLPMVPGRSVTAERLYPGSKPLSNCCTVQVSPKGSSKYTLQAHEV